MHILVVGASHRSCPIEVRERLAFQAEQLPAAYAALRHELGFPEALILSTCNRVEIYAGVPDVNGTGDRIASFLSAHSRLPAGELAPQLYTHQEPSSVQHLFAVASGLDSMVLGESEILHQVKRAYELARMHGTTGKALNTLFQKALNTGKAVRARTTLGHGSISVGTVALELAQKIFGDLRPYTVLLVGAGKVGELTIKRLTERGVSRVQILNRSPERAALLAAQHGAQAFGMDELTARLVDADIVITSTSAPQALMSRADLDAIMPLRRHRPLCIVDLGVPRNVDPEAGQLENVYLFDVDDLQGLAAHHQAQRRQAVSESQRIIEQKIEHFLAWWHQEYQACAPSSSALAAAP